MEFYLFLNNHNPEELKNYVIYEHEKKLYVEEKGLLSNAKRFILDGHFNYNYNILSVAEKIKGSEFADQMDKDWNSAIDNIVSDYKNKQNVSGTLKDNVTKTSEIYAKTQKKSDAPSPLIDGKWKRLGFTPKTYAFTNGDTFIGSTGLEGGNVQDNIDLILRFYEDREFKGKDKVVSILKSFSLASDPNLSERIKNLKTGEKILINGGWTTHAILYLVERTSDGKFAFSAVNTGAGINDFHQSEDFGLKVKYKPLVRVHQIEEAVITNPELWASFAELKIRNKADGSLWKHSADDIYRRILPALQGKRDLDFENDVDFITAQRGGTCSWKAVMKLISVTTGETKEYKKENLYFRYLSNVEFNDYILHSENPSNEDIQLLKKGSENFVRHALKMHQDGIINENDLKEILNLKEKIDSNIQAIEQRQKVQSFTIDPNERFPLQERLQASFFQADTPLPGVVTARDRFPEGVHVPKLDPFPQTFGDFKQALDDLHQASSELGMTSQVRGSLQMITNFVTSGGELLLQPGSIERLCEGQSAAEIEKVIESIYELHEKVLLQIRALPVNERMTPDHIALMTILGVLNTKFLKQIPDEHSPIKDGFQPIPGIFLEVMQKTPFAIIQNKELAFLFFQAAGYLKANFEGSKSFEKWFDIGENCFTVKFDSNDMLQKNTYMRDLLRNLQKNNAELSGLTDRKLLSKAMTTFGTDSCPLPKWFQVLLKQHLLCLCIKYDPDLSKAEFQDTHIKFIENQNQNYNWYEISFFGQKILFDNKSADALKKTSAARCLSQQKVVMHEGLKNVLANWKGLPSNMDDLYAYNTASNLAVMSKAEEGLTRQETQMLAYYCSSNLTIIPNLIAYFNEYFDKLADPDYQKFFFFALFSGEHLIDAIKNSPKVIEQLTAFLGQQYQANKRLGNVQQQLYFLRIMDDLNRLTKNPIPEIDVKNELEALAAGMEDKKNKALVYQQWIASHHDKELTEEETVKLAKAYVFVNIYGFEEHVDPSILDNMYRTMDQVFAKIGNLPINSQRRVAVESLRETLPEKLANEYTLDLTSLTIFKGAHPIGGLPYQIFQDPNFIELFGQNRFSAISLVPGIYEFTASTGNYRVFFKSTGELKIQKNIDGEWHTYVENDRLTKLFSSIALNKGYFHWVSGTEKPRMIIEKKEDHSVHSKITFKPLGKLEHMIASWDNILDQVEYTIAVWQKYDHQKKDYGVGLNRLSKGQALFLNRFQSKETILLWDDSIEFSSLGLEFNKKGDKYLYSKDPNYHLAHKQIPPTCLKYFSGYLRIVNDKGKVQYLIPNASLEKNVSGSLQQKISINTQATDFMAFKEENGKLVAKTVQEHLFLAYLHMAHKNYDEAYEALQQYNSGKPQGYGAIENGIMDRIYDYLEFANDNSPEGIAIALQAISLHIRNLSTEERQNAVSETRDMAANLLMQYYPLAQHARKYQLMPSQEKELLEFFGLTSETLKQRNQQIASFSAEIKLAENAGSQSIEEAFISVEKEEVENLYLNGEKKLASNFDELFAAIISEDPQIRLQAVSKLLLMKIPADSPLDKLRSMLVSIAKHDDEIRSKLSESLNGNRLGKIGAVIEAYGKIKEMKIESEKIEPISVNNSGQNPPIQLKVLDKREKASAAAKAEFKLSDVYKPPAHSIMEIFNERNLQLEQTVPEQIDNSKLINTFLTAGETASRVAKKEFKFVGDSIAAYTNKVNSSEKFTINDSQLDKIANASDDRRDSLLEKAEEQKVEIEKLLSKEPDDFRENMIYRLQVHGQVKKVLTVDDLMILYLQNNTEELLKQNPHLTEEDLIKLTELLTDYLVNMTECDYLENVKKASTTALKEKGEAKEKALNDLNILIRSDRSYDVKTDRIILIYEYSSGFRLRSDQIETIRSMTIDDPSKIDNSIIQLIMGSGKSKVILPLLAYLNSRGDNIPIIISPDALFEIQLEDSRIFSGQYLRQEREVITLKEGEQIGDKDIDEIIKKLERVKERRSYLLVNPTVIHSLRLYADSVYYELSETKDPSFELVSKYSKIKQVMTMLKNEGDVIIDESDLVLSCRKETNLARGEWENINRDTQDIIEDFFTLIVKDPELNRYIKIEKETETAFDETDYKNNIQPKLAQMFIDMALKEGMQIDDQQKKEIQDYLLSAKELTDVPLAFAAAPQKAQAVLAIGKEMIKTLLPLLITNHCDMDFGLSKKTRSNAAIPFAGSNNPSEGSTHGTPYESLIYTMVYYTRKGVSADRINFLIDHLKSEALRESKAKKIPLENTKAFNDFQELNLVPAKNLFTVQESEIVDALTIFNANVENRIRFARQFGWIEVKFNKERYSSNSQDLVGTFHSVKGFSGTLLHNFTTFHRSLVTKLDLSVIGMTLSLLHHSGSQVKPFANLETFIKSLANYNACIDIGCWFRGIAAIDVAKKILEVLPPKQQGVVYINDVDVPPGTKDQQVILLKGATEPILLSESKLKPDERFTYYNVITGVDILQDDFARAIATIGETTILRDVEQGGWRMRGLKGKQIVDFATPAELEFLQQPEDVFLFSTRNQAAIKEKDNPHALQQKIQHEIKALLETVLRDERISAKSAGEISLAGRQLIVKIGSQDPVQVFGGITSTEKMETIVNAQIAQALDYAKTKLYDEFPIFEQIMPYKTLEEQVRALPNYEDLPEEDYWQPLKKGQPSQADYGVKTQTKLKTETKTQTKMQLQVKAIEDTRTVARNLFGEVHWPEITSGNLFSDSQWKSFDEWKTLNHYLQGNQAELFNYDAKQPIFSENLHMSYFFKSFAQGYNTIPFQTGTKPEGICSLRINRRTGQMDLDFLHPNETEMLWKMLDSEKTFNAKKDEYLRRNEEAKAEFLKNAKNALITYFNPDKELPENVRSERILPKNVKLEDLVDKLMDIDWVDLLNLSEKWPLYMHQLIDLYTIIQPMWKNLMMQKMDGFLLLQKAEKMFNDEKDFDLILVNPSTGVVKAGNDDIDEERLKQNPEYHKLMAQAKFYHGKLDDYTPQEAEYLKKWAKEVGVERLESFLINDIFRIKAEERERYENSSLKQIFEAVA